MKTPKLLTAVEHEASQQVKRLVTAAKKQIGAFAWSAATKVTAAEQRKYIAAVEKTVAHAEKIIAQLKKRIATVKRQSPPASRRTAGRRATRAAKRSAARASSRAGKMPRSGKSRARKAARR
jgi:hypothetical protein